MTTAHQIKADNTQANAMNFKITLMNWSECLKMAWSIVKGWSGIIGEVVRGSIEIFRTNGGGFLKSKGILKIRKTL